MEEKTDYSYLEKFLEVKEIKEVEINYRRNVLLIECRNYFIRSVVRPVIDKYKKFLSFIILGTSNIDESIWVRVYTIEPSFTIKGMVRINGKLTDNEVLDKSNQLKFSECRISDKDSEGYTDPCRLGHIKQIRVDTYGVTKSIEILDSWIKACLSTNFKI